MEPRRSVLSCLERWLYYVVKGATAPEDLRTIGMWARHVGVSYSSWRTACYLADIPPHAARDLTRVLRAIALQRRDGGSLIDYLNESDPRSVAALRRRAGIAPIRTGSAPSIEQFCAAQRIVPVSHRAMRLLSTVLACPQEAQANTPSAFSPDRVW